MPLFKSFQKLKIKFNHWKWIIGFLLIQSFILNTLSAKEVKLRYFSSIGTDFKLMDYHGNNVSLSSFKGKVIVLFFGYTICPDVCPTTLFAFSDLLKQLGKDADKVRVLYVTVDPARDTAKKMKSYLGIFDKRIIGLRGNEKETARVAKKFLVRYKKKFLGNSENYLIDHTALIYLIDQKGKTRSLFPYNCKTNLILKLIKQLLNSDN